MVHVSISSHADLLALQDRTDERMFQKLVSLESVRSDERMFLKLVSLESVRIASDSYALLRNLIERRYWRCPQPQMDLLSLVAGVALELHKIKHDLFPLLVQETNLERGFLKALLLRNSAVTLISLAEDAKEIVEDRVGSLDENEKDVLLGKGRKVEDVGLIVEDTAREVLNGGTRNFVWLQGRVPVLLELVDVLLSTPVHFPNPE